MQTERATIFNEKEPEFSDDEVSRACEAGKIAASFKGKPVATSPEDISYVAVKFALHDGSFATVLLDYYSAQLLRGLIDSVDKMSWKTAAVTAGKTQH
jgi:hypothetical protein